MISWLFGWKEKLAAAGLAVVLLLGWIFKIRRDAERKGAQKATDAINKETQRTRDEWNKIDSSPVPVDDALSSLRQRAHREGSNT